MTDDTNRVELVIPLGTDITVAHRMMANTQPDQIVLRGDREQAGTLAMHLLAQLTGDEALFDKLQFGELRLALRTLGEIGAYGLDEDLAGELSESQTGVTDTLARIYEADMADPDMA